MILQLDGTGRRMGDRADPENWMGRR